jgi:RimJ/RimL family protein N-acetyltransferase
MNADPRVMEHFVAPMSPEETDEMVDRVDRWIADHGWGLFAVEVVDGPGFIGFVGLAEPRFEAPFTPAIEIGWRLDPSAWGHGYASEAARAVLEAAPGWGISEVVSFTTTTNTRSEAVMRRIGMTHDPEDDFDHPSVPVGHPLRRHVLYRWSAP